MDYSILAARTPDEEDGRLHPALTDPHTIALEPLDGEPLRLLASGLLVSERTAGATTTHLRIRKARAEVLISDARFAVGCAGLNEGLLVGHVRYPWLRCVGFKARAGWRSHEEVRLGVVVRAPDGGSRELFLDVRLPNDVDSAAVAKATVRRAARYRLVHGDLTDEAARSILEGFADGPRSEVESSKKSRLYQLPRASLVSAASAYPAANPAGGAQQRLAPQPPTPFARDTKPLGSAT